MLSDVGVWGVSECSGRPTFFIFIKKNWIYTMTRHHANNALLARNLPFDSDVRRWNHPLIIPLHCLLAKSNNKTSGQFEYDVNLNMTRLCFFVWFCSFACTVRLLFQFLFTFSSYPNNNILLLLLFISWIWFSKSYLD